MTLAGEEHAMADGRIVMSLKGAEVFSYFCSQMGEFVSVTTGKDVAAPCSFAWMDAEDPDDPMSESYLVELTYDANGDVSVLLLMNQSDRSEEYSLIGYCVANGIPYATEYTPTPEEKEATERRKAEEESAKFKRRRGSKPH
jgi:hypothetical protein